MSREHPVQTEMTRIGEQVLIPGMKPVTVKSRLQALAEAPLLPRKVQKPCDIGLFDEAARNQLSLF